MHGKYRLHQDSNARPSSPVAIRYTVNVILATTLHWVIKKPEEYGTRMYKMLHKDMDTVECNFKQLVFKNFTFIF
jgi:hypothetical protein